VAFNEAREDELEMVQNALDNDAGFQQLVYLWQKTLEQPWCCLCCRAKAKAAARRLRVALRRVVTCKGTLPPWGDPLIPGDDYPRPAHTPTYKRDVTEQMHFLQDKRFRHSGLAIDLAKNIIKRAQEERKEEEEAAARAATSAEPVGAGVSVPPPAGDRPGAPNSAAVRTSSARRTALLSTLRTDISLGGPHPSVIPSSVANEVIKLWLEQEEHLAHLFKPGPGQQQPPTSESRSAGAVQPPLSAAIRVPRTGQQTSSTSEIQPLLDTPESTIATQPDSMTFEVVPPPVNLAALRLRAHFAVEDSPSEAQQPARTTESSHTPDQVLSRAAFGSLVIVPPFEGPQVSQGLGGPSGSETTSGRGNVSGTLASELEATRTLSRAHNQNFGKNPRERRKLIAAAYRNIRMNGEQLPEGATWPSSQRRTGRTSSGSSSRSGGPRGGGRAIGESSSSSASGAESSRRGDRPQPARRIEGAFRRSQGDDSSRPGRRREDDSPQPSRRREDDSPQPSLRREDDSPQPSRRREDEIPDPGTSTRRPSPSSGRDDSPRPARPIESPPRPSRGDDSPRPARRTESPPQRSTEGDSPSPETAAEGATRREKEEAIRKNE
jgi:hypothetical protein